MTKQARGLQHSKKEWAGVKAFMPVFILSLVFSITPTKAQDAKQQMEYDVYAGGFHVVAADLTIDLAQKTDYVLRLGASTHGMLGKLAPWVGVFRTNG